MKINDIITELRKNPPVPGPGDTTPHDYNPGWQDLNWIKEEALKTGNQLAASGYQLFLPRPSVHSQTPRDRRLSNLTNTYAWDEKDPSKLKQQYADWEDGVKSESKLTEAPPILAPGKTMSPPGRNKPQAALWTSSAKKGNNGWGSDWSDWTHSEQKDWFSQTGYLYKVKPGALILTLNSDYDAERIYWAFINLDRTDPIDNNDGDGGRFGMGKKFPWDQIAKHFDGVWHSGYRGNGNEFMYGWDVESTAWFDTSHLTRVAEVPISQMNVRNNYGDDDE